MIQLLVLTYKIIKGLRKNPLGLCNNVIVEELISPKKNIRLKTVRKNAIVGNVQSKSLLY